MSKSPIEVTYRYSDNVEGTTIWQHKAESFKMYVEPENIDDVLTTLRSLEAKYREVKK